MRFLLSFIFYSTLIFANILNIDESNASNNLTPTQKWSGSFNESLTKPNQNNALENNTTDTNDINLSNKIEKKQNIFISYEETPNNIFVGQQFFVKVKAIIATDNFDKIKNKIVSQDDIKVLNTDENWTKKSDSIYYKTFYLRAIDNNATFPQIYLELYKEGDLTSSQAFPNLDLNIIKLHTDKYYSHVVANSLDIIKVKTTKFDENSLMIVLEIVAKNANLKDFKLRWVIRDGIDSFVENFPETKIFYYAIIPKYTDKFIFTYFNIQQNRFIKKTINVIINNEDISTQSDLNPQDSIFNLYKNIAYGAFGVLSLLIFFKRRRIIYLLLFFGLITMFFININPLRNIKINQNSKIYILPTRNSTIFYITPKILEVQKLNTRENYIKIILPDGKIGWVKEKNVIKN